MTGNPYWFRVWFRRGDGWTWELCSNFHILAVSQHAYPTRKAAVKSAQRVADVAGVAEIRRYSREQSLRRDRRNQQRARAALAALPLRDPVIPRSDRGGIEPQEADGRADPGAVR
jgi:hypothetical protein